MALGSIASRIVAVLLVSSWTGGCAYDSCRVSEPRRASAPAGGAVLVRVDAQDGSLRIKGAQGLTEVIARGTACGENRRAVDGVLLEAVRSGDEIQIRVETPDDFGRTGTLDLEVEVPFDLPLVVTDDSGQVDVSDVASVELTDGGGGIDVARVSGDVIIRDTTGEVDVSEVAGDVTIHDGSGEIDVRLVTGSVLLSDGSGEIDVGGVDGNVTVEADGTGDITIEGVERNVLIERDGSGGIRVVDVGGAFIVRSAGSGPIVHEAVAGRVELPER